MRGSWPERPLKAGGSLKGRPTREAFCIMLFSLRRSRSNCEHDSFVRDHVFLRYRLHLLPGYLQDLIDLGVEILGFAVEQLVLAQQSGAAERRLHAFDTAGAPERQRAPQL